MSLGTGRTSHALLEMRGRLEPRPGLGSAAPASYSTPIEAVDLMYGVGGATPVYADTRLDRCFRNVHTAVQHVTVWPQNLEAGGRLLLGLDSGNHFYP